MNHSIPSFDPEASEENILAEVVFMQKGRKFKAMGVLLKDSADGVRIGFNAKDDTVVDSLEIDRKEVRSLRKVADGEILTVE